MVMQEGSTRAIDPVDPYRGLEAWKNTARGVVWITRLTGRYGETEPMKVPGGGTFHVTPAERHLNSDVAYAPSADPFRNGQFVLVKASPETPQTDLVIIERSAAGLTDDEIARMFGAELGEFTKAIDQIDNATALLRILEAAKLADAPYSRVEAVRGRLRQLAPEALVEDTPLMPIPGANGEDEPDQVSIAPTGDPMAAMLSDLGEGFITVGEK